ncbi:MAG: hypothetical protein J6T34_00745, partial [Bacilli bacterium]|nr:hypothetical protein [Bacilli bacterium]
YFVRNSTGSIVIGSREGENPAIAFDVYNINTYGYNALMAPGQISLRYNSNVLSSWSSEALIFNNPTNGNKGMDLTSYGLRFYDATGQIVQAEFGGTQATISGTINAYSGQFGSSTNNYWLIDTFYDANQQTNYSSLHSKGDSFIQLGDNNTWTILTDRISSGWRYMSTNADGITNPYYFRYKQFVTNGTYYDYGMHIPSILNTSDQNQKRLSDKFLYIRYANYVNDDNLSNLELDSSWTYPFYVDSQGNVRAKAFYVGNSTTSIGGGAGTIAEKLTQGYGSATHPIYFDSGGVAQETTYQLNAAGAKGVVTSISADSTDLPTVTAVKNYISGLGYTTNVGTVTSVRVQASDPLQSSTSTAQSGSLNTTISFKNQNVNTVLAGPSSGSAAAPTFRALVAADIPDLSGTYLTSHQNVTNNAETLAWNTTKTIATIGGTNITVKLPSNPNSNTTYTFANGTNGFTVTPSDGTAQTVTVTPSITNNVTGSGTSGNLVKWNGTNTVTSGPALGTDTTKFLNNKGEWAVPGGTYTLATATYNTLGGVKPWFSTTGASTLPSGSSASSYTNTPAISARTTTANRYYAIEIDTNGRLFVNVPWTNVNSNYLTEITGSDVTTALGYTPYNATNPNGYTTNTGTVTSVRVQASSPLQSSTSTAQTSTLNTTISFSSQNSNLVLAGPSSGNAAAPTFRSLVAADIPSLSWNKITSDKPTTLSGYGITDAAGLNALVGLSASSNSAGVTTFTATRASGSNPLSFEVSIVASEATGANALRDSDGLISKGSATKPVYFSDGVPVEGNTYAGGTAVTLNGTSKTGTTASFYAPTGAGSNGQYLTSSGNGAPSWTNLPTIPTITLNGTTTTSPSFYAPTSAGTTGYVLVANANGAPSWTAQS